MSREYQSQKDGSFGECAPTRWVWALFMSHTTWDYRNAKNCVSLKMSDPESSQAHDLRVMISPTIFTSAATLTSLPVPKHLFTGLLPLQLFPSLGKSFLQVFPWSLFISLLRDFSPEHSSKIAALLSKSMLIKTVLFLLFQSSLVPLNSFSHLQYSVEEKWWEQISLSYSKT